MSASAPKLIVWLPFCTAKLCCTCEAAFQFASPAWFALIVQVPTATKLTLVPEIIRVDELVRESIVLNKAFGERFKVRYEASGGLPERTVNADRKRLLQVMTNLLSNAAKFSPEGDVVLVSTEDRGTAVRIAVHDRGSGIPENFRNRIFGRFTQADSTTARQKGGTGLGLAICKRLVEMMQGRIGFEDRPGGGTSFYFELPRH